MNSIRPQSLPTVLTKDFSKVPDVKIERSKFRRPHGYKTTLDAGYAVPVFLEECIPGDSHSLRGNFFVRLTTPIKPVMDNMYLDVMYFFCPMRLVWENTERFFGERDPDPDSSIAYTIPQVVMPTTPGVIAGSVFNYMGLPIGLVETTSVSSLPLRCYNKIWNDWMRDENLVDSATVRLTDTGDVPGDFALLRAGKRYDYFTSCLSNPQKGSTAVSLPVGASSAPVTMVPFATSGAVMLLRDNASGDPLNTENAAIGVDAAGRLQTNAIGTDLILDPNTRLVADLSTALATTVEQLRNAIQTQMLLEKDARGGTRYIEHNWVHFGVRSSNRSLQRSQFLGGGTMPVNFHPVPQTTVQATPTQTDAQGNLSAFATASGQIGFSTSIEEHGYILGIARVRADYHYQEGIDKLWSRTTRYDFAYPVFAHLGEQAVLNKEIFADGSANDDLTFGYQERFAEYRFKKSLITGELSSLHGTPLDYWHLAEEFATLPVLNEAFIEEDPPVDRVIAVTSAPHFFFDSHSELVSARPLPVYSVPTLGGRV